MFDSLKSHLLIRIVAMLLILATSSFFVGRLSNTWLAKRLQSEKELFTEADKSSAKWDYGQAFCLSESHQQTESVKGLTPGLDPDAASGSQMLNTDMLTFGKLYII